MSQGIPGRIEWRGETHSTSEWARRLGTTRDKIRTRHAHGLRLDADTIGGRRSPLRPNRKRAKAAPPAAPPMSGRVAIITVLIDLGYRVEAAVIRGEECLIVRAQRRASGALVLTEEDGTEWRTAK